MEQKKLVLGVFGFGVVGEGLYRVLQKSPSMQATFKKACIKDASKKRNAPAELFTTDKNDILNDPEINVVVEVITDAEAAFEIVSTAMKNGKSVVSASKKMVAEHLEEIIQLQQETGQSFLCESAACASIPVIRNLEEYYDNDLLHSLKAIVNGSSNFILTKMFQDKLPFDEALLLAQQLGFAEADPSLDVEGYDSLNKWTILLAHAYGIIAKPEQILFTGIQHISLHDAVVAKERSWEIKLVAQALKLKSGKVGAFVLPQFVDNTGYLAFVKNEFNGVVIESGFADQQFFYGKGAGSLPTGSAVLSDISALGYGYKYEYKKLYYHEPNVLSNDFYLHVYVSFDLIRKIQKDDFEWIDEWHSGAERSYLVGVISFEKLAANKWWKSEGISLIVMPGNPIIEDIETRKIKQLSLELAGFSTFK